MSGDDDRETLRFFKFSGDEDEWVEWKEKTLSLARKEGYSAALEYDLSTSLVSLERKANDEAFDLLLISCKKTPFGIVKRKKGNAYEAWKSLVHSFSVGPQEPTIPKLENTTPRTFRRLEPEPPRDVGLDTRDVSEEALVGWDDFAHERFFFITRQPWYWTDKPSPHRILPSSGIKNI